MTTVDPLADLLDAHGIERRGIVHVGAHLGQEVPVYQAAGFSPIVLVEPNPRLAAELRRMSGVTVFEAACAAHSGTRTLHITKHDKLSSLHKPVRRRAVVRKVEVHAVPLADLIDASVNVAIIDAQGAELEVVAGAPLDRLDVLVIETFVQPKAGGAPGHAETVAMMRLLGWRLVAAWPLDEAGRNVDAVFVKAP